MLEHRSRKRYEARLKLEDLGHKLRRRGRIGKVFSPQNRNRYSESATPKLSHLTQTLSLITQLHSFNRGTTGANNVTMQEPNYLSQGVNYLGFLAQQLGDLRGKATLVHELIQNADDAKDELGYLSATEIAFDVTDDALIVRNDSVFRETDFDRMRELASGAKRREAGDRTTGAFGVGFISVYQVTDRPEIHSAGRRWTFGPDQPETGMDYGNS